MATPMMQREDVADYIEQELGWRPGSSTLYRLMKDLPGAIGGRKVGGFGGGWLRVPAVSVAAWVDAQRGGAGSETGAEVVTGEEVASAPAA